MTGFFNAKPMDGLGDFATTEEKEKEHLEMLKDSRQRKLKKICFNTDYERNSKPNLIKKIIYKARKKIIILNICNISTNFVIYFILCLQLPDDGCVIKASETLQ